MAAVRQVTGDRKVIESRAKEKIVEMTHQINEFFVAENLNFITVHGNKQRNAPGIAVICRNVGQLIKFVSEKRESTNFHAEFGIGGGGGSLKISLSLCFFLFFLIV